MLCIGYPERPLLRRMLSLGHRHCRPVHTHSVAGAHSEREIGQAGGTDRAHQTDRVHTAQWRETRERGVHLRVAQREPREPVERQRPCPVKQQPDERRNTQAHKSAWGNQCGDRSGSSDKQGKSAAERERGENRQTGRHRAVCVQADIDPRDPGQKKAEAKGKPAQEGRAQVDCFLPVDEKDPDADRCERPPAERGKCTHHGRTCQCQTHYARTRTSQRGQLRTEPGHRRIACRPFSRRRPLSPLSPFSRSIRIMLDRVIRNRSHGALAGYADAGCRRESPKSADHR